MSRDHRQSEKDEIACEILSYLSEHLGAQDTLEGIVHWWLMERRIESGFAIVKKTLDELVAKGFILEKKIGDYKNQYRINLKKCEEIQEMFKNIRSIL